MALASTKVQTPKIVYASGTKVLYPNTTPARLSPSNLKAVRFDSLSTAGKRQSIFQRTDNLLDLEFRFIDTLQMIRNSEDFTLTPWTTSTDLKIGKNYLLRSDEFNHAIWTKTGTPSIPIVTTNAVAGPDGLTTADQIDFPATGAGESNKVAQIVTLDLPSSGVVADQSFTFSIYLLADSPLNIVLIVDGGSPFEAGTSLGQSVTTEWQRFSVTHTFGPGSTSTTLNLSITQAISSAAKTIYAAGAQVEYGTIPGDYTPTTTTAQVLLIADPFFEELTSSFTPALPELVNALPRRARQLVVTKASTNNNLIQDIVGKVLYNLRNEALTMSAWFKRQDASPPSFNFNLSDGNDVQRTDEFISIGGLTPTTSWLRYHATGYFSPGNLSDTIKLKNFVHNAIGTYYAFGFNLTKSTGLLDYQVAGDIASQLDAWDDFFRDVLQGNTFDYYPDAWDSAFTTYHLTSKAFKPQFLFKDNYQVRLSAREEI